MDEPAARDDLYPGLISATPGEFVRQMEYIASTCRAVDVAEVLRAVRGDGRLPPRAVLVTFDDVYRIRDIYYPQVGMPNHTAGHEQRFGVWVDGRFAWIGEEGWERDLRYKPDTMVTEVVLRHGELEVEVLWGP